MVDGVFWLLSLACYKVRLMFFYCYYRHFSLAVWVMEGVHMEVQSRLCRYLVGFPYAGRGFGILISCLISVCHHVTCVFEASVPLDNACAMSKSLDLLDSESDKN